MRSLGVKALTFIFHSLPILLLAFAMVGGAFIFHWLLAVLLLPVFVLMFVVAVGPLFMAVPTAHADALRPPLAPTIRRPAR